MRLDDKGIVYLRILVNGIPRDSEAEIKAILEKHGYELKKKEVSKELNPSCST